MRRFLLFMAAFLVTYTIGVVLFVFVIDKPRELKRDPMQSVLRVDVPDGHGSAFVIGHGLFITAAHVVTVEEEEPEQKPDEKKPPEKKPPQKKKRSLLAVLGGEQKKHTVSLVAQNGDQATGTILWISKDYDVALGEIGTGINVPGLDINCTTVKVGDTISGYGNPRTLKFMRTQGTVAGFNPEDNDNIIVDMAVVSGMSGGPALNKRGQVVGMIDAVMMLRTLGLGDLVPGPLGMIVPSSKICRLLGRL
jgi:S1-C subfamily serine protease